MISSLIMPNHTNWKPICTNTCTNTRKLNPFSNMIHKWLAHIRKSSNIVTNILKRNLEGKCLIYILKEVTNTTTCLCHHNLFLLQILILSDNMMVLGLYIVVLPAFWSSLCSLWMLKLPVFNLQSQILCLSHMIWC